MVIRNTERGNDLTRRTVDVYTREELPSLSIEQAVADVRGFARTIQSNDPTAVHVEDSSEQIADNLLGKIDLLVEAVHDGKVKPNEVALIALHVGKLAERLEWMVRHEDTTRKGIQRKDHEQLRQKKGVEALKKERRQNIQKVAALVKSKVEPSQQAIMKDAALARHLLDLGHSNLGKDRTVRGYIAQARKWGWLPTTSTQKK
jgi:hypothetical protein